MGFPANGASATDKSLKFLIYGRSGWIGGVLGRLCQAQSIDFAYASGRLENRESLVADLATVKPTHVFNAAGVTGRPNVDWCESHKVETIRTNVVGTLTLADVCREKGLVLINYATGCIFEYDSDHPLGSGIGFKEEDTPNFIGSFYSKTKAMVEDLLKNYENVANKVFLIYFDKFSVEFSRTRIMWTKANRKNICRTRITWAMVNRKGQGSCISFPPLLYTPNCATPLNDFGNKHNLQEPFTM